MSDEPTIESEEGQDEESGPDDGAGAGPDGSPSAEGGPELEPNEAEGTGPEPPKQEPAPAGRSPWRGRRLAAIVAVGLSWVGLLALILVRTPLIDPSALNAPGMADAGPSARAVLSAGQGRLSVRVLDVDGHPLEDALVVMRMEREGRGALLARASTRSDGTALVLGLPDGLAHVTVERPGMARITRVVRIADGRGRVSVTLRPGASLAGLVVDTEGQPVSGALVRVRPARDDAADPWEAQTDDEGRFAFDTLRPGMQRVEASAPGYDTATQRLPAGLTDVRLSLRRTGEVVGRVVGPGSEPAPGATVVLAGSGVWPPRQTTTDEQGQFSVAGVPAGVYEVRAHRGNLVADPVEGLLLEAGGSARVTLRLTPGITLHGVVITAEDDAPIAEAEIVVAEDALSFTPRVARTGEDGTFEIEGLRRRPHRITVHAEGYVPIIAAQHEPGEEPVRFALRRAAILEGVVVDDDDRPVAGAQVAVQGTTEGGEPIVLTGSELSFREALFEAQLAGPMPVLESGELGVTLGTVPPIPIAPGDESSSAPGPTGAAYVTDAQGRFRLTGIPPGRVQLSAFHPDYAPAMSEMLVVVAGSHRDDLRLVMPQGGTVEGRVVDGRGFPVGFLRVEMRTEGEPFPRVALAAEDGTFSFAAALGTTTLTAYPSGMPAARKTVQVLAGQTLEVELALEGELVTLHVRTVDARGFPMAGVSVSVRSLRAQSPMQLTSRSADDGTLELGGLPPPPWQVVADHEDYALVRLDDVRSAEDELVIELVPGAAVRGRVLSDWDGAPVPNAVVTIASRSLATPTDHTDSEGTFEISRVPSGNYRVSVAATGFLAAERSVRLERRSVGLLDVEVPDIRLTAGGDISGEVVDALGSGVSGAEVAVGAPPDWASAVRTDAQGRFRLVGVAAATVSVSARHPAAGEATEGGVRVVARDETTGVRIRLPERYDEERLQAAGAGIERRTGVAVDVRDSAAGVVIRTVVAGSQAARAAIRRGDVVVAVDGEQVTSAAHARAMLRGAAGVDAIVEVRRRGRSVRIPVPRESYESP